MAKEEKISYKRLRSEKRDENRRLRQERREERINNYKPISSLGNAFSTNNGKRAGVVGDILSYIVPGFIAPFSPGAGILAYSLLNDIGNRINNTPSSANDSHYRESDLSKYRRNRFAQQVIDEENSVYNNQNKDTDIIISYLNSILPPSLIIDDSFSGRVNNSYIPKWKSLSYTPIKNSTSDNRDYDNKDKEHLREQKRKDGAVITLTDDEIEAGQNGDLPNEYVPIYMRDLRNVGTLNYWLNNMPRKKQFFR